MTDYYDRRLGTNTDGTAVFATDSDIDRQQDAAYAFKKKLGDSVQLADLGRLSQVDYLAAVHGRPHCCFEVKCRSHESGRYGTVFLNVRKWLALQMLAAGMNIEAFFVVAFTDCTKYISLRDVDATVVRHAGTSREVKSHLDREFVIEVPVDAMQNIE